MEPKVRGKNEQGLRGWGYLQLKGLPRLQHATSRRAFGFC